MKTINLICLCTVVSLLCAVPSSAATYYWYGGVDTNYTTWENWWTANGGTGTQLTTAPFETADSMYLQYAQGVRPDPVIAADDTVTIRDTHIGRSTNGFGQLDIHGNLVTTYLTELGRTQLDIVIAQGHATSSGILNVFSGGSIDCGNLDNAQTGTGTMTIENGGYVFVADRFRFGQANINSIGTLYLNGTLEVVADQTARDKDAQFRLRNQNHVVYIGDEGQLLLRRDLTDLVQDYINRGRVTAAAVDREMMMTLVPDVYTSTADPIQTKVETQPDRLGRTPHNRTVVDPVKALNLEWTLPDPNAGADYVVVDVYLGVGAVWNDPNLGLPRIVTKSANETYPIAANTLEIDRTYRWFMDVYDVYTVEGQPEYVKRYRNTPWSFQTSPARPIVEAAANISTWLVDGQRVVELEAIVYHQDPEIPFTIGDWTKVEPEAPWTLGATTATEVETGVFKVTAQVTATATGNHVFRLEADDGTYQGSDTMRVIVYADACVHASNQPGFAWLVGDINQDCKVNLEDVADLASQWLLNYESPE